MNLSFRLTRRTWQLIVAVALIAAVGSVSLLQANADSDTVVMVNGEPIDRDMFYQALERFTFNGESLGAIALRQLISEALVIQANSKHELGVTDEMVTAEFEKVRSYYGDDFELMLQQVDLTEDGLRDEIRINLILERLVLQGIEVTEEQMQSFYEENKGSLFTEPERYRASHILVESKDEAEAILDELAKGATFAELRAEHTLDNSEWGPLSQYDEIPAAIKDALFALQVGEVSKPVETALGYVLIRLEEITPERQATYEEVKDVIRDHLLYSQAPAVEDVLAELWADAQIEVQWDRYKGIEVGVE